MPTLTSIPHVVPTGGVQDVKSALTVANYRPSYVARTTLLPTVSVPAGGPQRVSGPLNGGTYAPSRGGTAVSSALSFVWTTPYS